MLACQVSDASILIYEDLVNKSSPKSFGKSKSLRLIADNVLVRCTC